MKVTSKEKEQIQKIYLKYRAVFPKEESLRRTAKETGRGRTTCWDNVEELDSPVEEKKPLNFKPQYGKTYIISAWEVRVGVDHKFVKTLQRLAEYHSAELLLVPCLESDLPFIPKELSEVFTIVTEDIQFNENLRLRYVETNALVQSPLSGHAGAYPTSSIIPGLVKELRSEPSVSYIKQCMSTGSVGYLNASTRDYSEIEGEGILKRLKAVRTRRNGKASAIAANYVTPSALIVDVLDKKTFLTRFVTSYDNGIVYDLDRKFNPEGSEKIQPAAILLGDLHAYNVDPVALTASKDMIQSLKPKEVILGDAFDGASVNYHEVASAVKFANAPTIREEADVTMSLIKEFCDMSEKVVYLQSNHCNFLIKFLDTSERLWRLHKNYEMSCGLQLFRLHTGLHPVVKLLELSKFDNLQFVSERDNYFVNKVLVKHGHEGSGGGRVGFNALSRIYNYYACGHEHAPKVFRNAMCVGLLGRLDMEYVVGVNAMAFANGLIHNDGSTQLLNIIGSKWRKFDPTIDKKTLFQKSLQAKILEEIRTDKGRITNEN